jgi:hypothetical protein
MREGIQIGLSSVVALILSILAGIGMPPSEIACGIESTDYRSFERHNTPR